MGNEMDFKELDFFIRKKVNEDLFSGAILIAKNKTPLFTEAYGYACINYNIPNRIDTKFNIGSLNKIFTHVAIAQLAEKSLIEYNIPIKNYLPDYPNNLTSKITVNHLLNNTSGLGHYWNEKFYSNIGNLRKVDDFIRLFLDEPLAFEPGEKYQYSNNGYVLLGKIVEVQSGQDYYNYIRENIYKPAGMQNSDHYERDMPIPNLAIGYTNMNKQGQPTTGPRRDNCYRIGVKGSPAGGGYSTVYDLLRFDVAIDENKLFSPEYTRTIFPLKRTKENGKPYVILRAGGASGVSAFYLKYPDHGYTAIVLSNYDFPEGKIVIDKIQEIINANLD